MLFESCQKDRLPPLNYISNFDNSVARNWFNLQARIIKETPGYTAPVAARSFAYAGVTLYQAVYPGMPGYESLEGKINGLSLHNFTPVDDTKTYNWALVANAAMAEFYKSIFKNASSSNLKSIDSLSLINEVAFQKNISNDVIENSVAYGKLIAKEVYEYSVSDGMDAAYNTNYPAYAVPKGPGLWVPTGTQQVPLQPYWGVVRPFLNKNTELTQIPPSPTYSLDPSSEFFKQATEVYLAVKDLTKDQEIITNFWSDEPGKSLTPAGHAISIASQILEKERADLSTAAETYLKVGLALHDAYVSCWKCKYTHNVIRPVSFIRANIDEAFQTSIYTPPTPEYTSDYAAQSSAAFTVLTNLFGEGYHFSDFTNFGRTDIVGIPRNYTSFEEAAQEAGYAGLYGGIHFRSSIEAGLSQGKQIGNNISQIKIKK